MVNGEQGRRLCPVPFRIVRTAEGVVLKRAATEIAIIGEGAAALVEALVAAAASGATRDEICEQFPAPEQPFVAELVDQLVASRLLQEARGSGEPSVREDHLDLLYWQLGASAREVTERLDRAGIVLVGANQITRQLARSLRATGVSALRVVDDGRLRDGEIGAHDPLSDLQRIDAAAWTASTVGCVVAGSTLGNQQVLREWNARCVERRHVFLPVLLQNFVGYVGPIVVPGQTACFDCLRARWNAHIDETHTRSALDELAIDGHDVIGFHPAMASMLGDLAAFELTRLLGRSLPNRRIGVQLELDLLRPQLTSRRVLKLPRCPTCSPLHATAPVTPRKER